MASIFSCSAASTGDTFNPVVLRTAASVSTSSGSAMASVMVWSSRPTGMQRNCRRKRGDSASVSGDTGGGPSMVTSASFNCSESAASTSRMATKPMSTSVLPILSPRSFCSSSAFSKSSEVIRPFSSRISPSRIALELFRGHGAGQRGFVGTQREQRVLRSVHHDLRRQPRRVFSSRSEQGKPQRDLFVLRQRIQRCRHRSEHVAHGFLQLWKSLHLLLMTPLRLFLGDLLMKRRDSSRWRQIDLAREHGAVATDVQPLRQSDQAHPIVWPHAQETLFQALLHVRDGGVAHLRFVTGRRTCRRACQQRRYRQPMRHCRTSAPLVSLLATIHLPICLA